MIKNAEKTNLIAKEQYGSRVGHRSIDLAVNKTLSSDILCQLRRPGAICSNNTKSCYDLIGHSAASIAMQTRGVPKSAVDCLFLHYNLQLTKFIPDRATLFLSRGV
jgi:hypothetical protein